MKALLSHGSFPPFINVYPWLAIQSSALHQLHPYNQQKAQYNENGQKQTSWGQFIPRVPNENKQYLTEKVSQWNQKNPTNGANNTLFGVVTHFNMWSVNLPINDEKSHGQQKYRSNYSPQEFACFHDEWGLAVALYVHSVEKVMSSVVLGGY